MVWILPRTKKNKSLYDKYGPALAKEHQPNDNDIYNIDRPFLAELSLYIRMG